MFYAKFLYVNIYLQYILYHMRKRLIGYDLSSSIWNDNMFIE